MSVAGAGPGELLDGIDLEAAREQPELAVLVTAAHGRAGDANAGDDAGRAAEFAAVALRGCETLDTRRAIRYADFVMASLGEAARRVLENHMNLDHHEFQSDFARKYVKQGREERSREVLLRLLAQRFGEVSDAVRERVEDAGFEDLDRWVDRVIPAGTLEDVFSDR